MRHTLRFVIGGFVGSILMVLIGLIFEPRRAVLSRLDLRFVLEMCAFLVPPAFVAFGIHMIWLGVVKYVTARGFLLKASALGMLGGILSFLIYLSYFPFIFPTMYVISGGSDPAVAHMNTVYDFGESFWLKSLVGFCLLGTVPGLAGGMLYLYWLRRWTATDQVVRVETHVKNLFHLLWRGGMAAVVVGMIYAIVMRLSILSSLDTHSRWAVWVGMLVVLTPSLFLFGCLHSLIAVSKGESRLSRRLMATLLLTCYAVAIALMSELKGEILFRIGLGGFLIGTVNSWLISRGQIVSYGDPEPAVQSDVSVQVIQGGRKTWMKIGSTVLIVGLVSGVYAFVVHPWDISRQYARELDRVYQERNLVERNLIHKLLSNSFGSKFLQDFCSRVPLLYYDQKNNHVYRITAESNELGGSISMDGRVLVQTYLVRYGKDGTSYRWYIPRFVQSLSMKGGDHSIKIRYRMRPPFKEYEDDLVPPEVAFNPDRVYECVYVYDSEYPDKHVSWWISNSRVVEPSGSNTNSPAKQGEQR